MSAEKKELVLVSSMLGLILFAFILMFKDGI
jgi:hypothetical protein